MILRFLSALVFVQVFLVAQIDFSQHQIENGETRFAVTGVVRDDVLNVREKPTYKSAIRYKLTANAKNIMSYESEMNKKVGKSVWVAIRIGVDDGFINGYVNAKYLKFSEDFESIEHKGLRIMIPYFMNAKKTEEDWINVFHSISFNHYSGCDQRDNPELLHTLVDFEIELKIYSYLKEALLDTLSFDQDNFSNYYNASTDWFKTDKEVGFEKTNYYGLEGYRYTMGVEGCGEVIYFLRVKEKILVIKEPFNFNPPIIKEQESLPKNWKFRDKDEILKSIVKSITLKEE